MAGCKKTPYPNDSLNNQLVILAEITAGDSLKVPSVKVSRWAAGVLSVLKRSTPPTYRYPPGRQVLFVAAEYIPGFCHGSGLYLYSSAKTTFRHDL